VAARVVTYRREKWAIDSFAPYKSPGINGILLALLQEGWRILVPYLVKIFRACLVTGYIPAIWHQVKFVFIPTPSKNSYCGRTDFRLISLTLFLLKTMDRLVDRPLRDEILPLIPLHPNQHAYQVGKSVETALHQLVVWVKALDLRETALGVFLHIEGAFNNTSYTPCVLLFSNMGLTTPSYSGLELPCRAAWLQQLLVDLPRVLRYLAVVQQEMFCHHSYAALLLMI